MNKVFDIIKNLSTSCFKTPIYIKEDNMYYDDLESKYQLLINEFSTVENMPIIIEAKEMINKLLSAIKNYFEGEIFSAYQNINCIVKDLIKSDLCYESVNKHYAFKNFISRQKNRGDYSSKVMQEYLNEKVDFYKGRVCNNLKSPSSEDMLHIPFNKRGKIATQRFSIPGIPCMYLSTSVYCCWKELGAPEDKDFYVTHVELNDLKIFNLAVNLNFLQDCINTQDKISDDFNFNINELISIYFKVWILNIATSYIVEEKERNFKSEYIIPQFIMMSLKENNIDGVVYYSKKLDEHRMWTTPKNLNLAILSEYHAENSEQISLKKKVKNTEPISYREFKNLSDIYIKKIMDKAVNKKDILNDFKNTVYMAGEYHAYKNTDFYRFEEYIKGLNNR